MNKKGGNKKTMEITKEEATKLNKDLAKHRKDITKEELKTATEEGMKEEQKTIDYLRDPKFIIYIVEEVQKEVSGEEDTIISEIIVSNTRLVENVNPESKNLFLSDLTGIGKDHVTKKTLKVVIPEEDHFHITKISKEAFTYWRTGKNWDRKVIHFEDIEADILNSSTFKTMASGGSHAVVVVNHETKEIQINGKPVMILTSHHANPESEALRRFPIGSLNETKKQTRKVKDSISKRYAGRGEKGENISLRQSVQRLKPYPVIIPYAELIQHFFPEDVLMRTHYPRFLDYICSSAVLHQYQRKKTKKGEIIAEGDDYMIARIVLIYTTSNPKMIPMSKEYRDLVKILQEHIEPMTVNDIYIKYDKSKDWLYKNLPNLVETKLISMDKTFKEEANKDIFTYQYILGENPYAIPTWIDIGKKIEEITNKTNKTNKTPYNSLLEKWFYCNKIKPLKPKTGGFYLVLFGHNITFSREVLRVFLVLSNYLCKRDEKRYKKYYEDLDLPLMNKLQDLKKLINDNRKAGYKIDDDFLATTKFEPNFISQCIESGLLIRQGSGEYVLA